MEVSRASVKVVFDARGWNASEMFRVGTLTLKVEDEESRGIVSSGSDSTMDSTVESSPNSGRE